jgi:hypothetical protein
VVWIVVALVRSEIWDDATVRIVFQGAGRVPLAAVTLDAVRHAGWSRVLLSERHVGGRVL